MKFEDFEKILNELDVSALSGNPNTFNLNDFDEEIDFTKAMFFAALRFKNEDEIVVRYSKKLDNDNNAIIVFQIAKSKSKLFLNYLKNNDLSITCILSSNKELKECIKFFNSIGIKGEGMIPLSSKEYDYVSILKEGLEGYNKYKEMMGERPCDAFKLTISIERDENSEVDYPMLSYEYNIGNGYTNFSDTKAWIKREILKIKE